MTNTNVITLFDMDGTLTLPRKTISNSVIKAVVQLSQITRIGIITGSDFEYILEQCGAMFNIGGVPIENVDLLPCNGTKLIKWENAKHTMVHEVDMIEKIGKSAYKNILTKIFEWQAEIARFYPELPFSGTFFQYRGSLLNWCPIGRIANDKQRIAWKKWDEDYCIRQNYMDELQVFIAREGFPVTVALGGSTSFDIYPRGWNKTYGLKHYDGWKVMFIGDKCRPNGNDWHLYSALESQGNAWETNGPEDTINIINRIIEKLSIT